jgi:hypothetical protein
MNAVGVVVVVIVIVTGTTERKEEQNEVAEVECCDKVERTLVTDDSEHTGSSIVRQKVKESTLSFDKLIRESRCKVKYDTEKPHENVEMHFLILSEAGRKLEAELKSAGVGYFIWSCSEGAPWSAHSHKA